MNLKDSEFERKYNKYWDTVIVPLDALIRNRLSTPGFFSQSGLKGLTLKSIDEYYCGVMNIINNLSRQCEASKYDDSDYVEWYIHEAREQALGDLEDYKKILEHLFKCGSEMHKYIRGLVPPLEASDPSHPISSPSFT